MFSDDVGGQTGPQSAVDITEPVKARRIKAVDEIKRALEIAEVAPFHYLIQHFGMVEAEFDEHRIDAAFASLEEPAISAWGKEALRLLLENIPESNFPVLSACFTFLAITHLDFGTSASIPATLT